MVYRRTVRSFDTGFDKLGPAQDERGWVQSNLIPF